MRFRESQTSVIDEHFNASETTKMRIETLYVENQDMEARLEEMKRTHKAMESKAAEKVRRNDELKKRLLELRHGQEKVTERLDKARVKKGELTAILEDKTAMIMAVRQESAKLKPYVLQSPAALQASLADLSSSLAADKATIEMLDRRARALFPRPPTVCRTPAADAAPPRPVAEDVLGVQVAVVCTFTTNVVPDE